MKKTVWICDNCGEQTAAPAKAPFWITIWTEAPMRVYVNAFSNSDDGSSDMMTTYRENGLDFCSKACLLAFFHLSTSA